MASIEVVLKLAPQQTNRQRAVLTRTEPVILLELAPDATLRAEQFIQGSTVETEISNVPLLTNSSTNTDSYPTHSRGMRHYDGGWPNNVDVEEREGRAKHCKKVEREDGYLATCHNLVTVTKPFLRLNEAIDIFEIYDRFTAAPPEASSALSAGQRSGVDADRDRPTTTNEPPVTATAPVPLPTAPDSEGALSVCMKFAAPFPDCRVSQVAFTCGSDSEMMAVSYVRAAAAIDLQHSFPNVSDSSSTMAAAVWNLSSCVAPAHTLHSRYGGCSAIACCPKDPFQVVGGSVTGVVQVWDLRKGYCPDTASSSSGQTTFHLPVMSNKRLESHTDAITDAKYVLSKGVDLMTCSLDGKVYFWDLRNLSTPLMDETLELGAPVSLPAKAGGSPSESTAPTGGFDAAAFGPTTMASSSAGTTSLTPCYLDYDPMVGGIQQYLVGTAEGMVLACSRRGKKKTDRILHRYHASLSSVFTVQRNPALPKIFLTVGDWGWRLFGDEVPTPIMAGAPRQRQVTCGRWNATRPSMLYTGTVSGHVEVWDLLRHGPKAPVEELCVSDAPLKECLPHPNGRHVAVADDCGHMYLLSVPPRVSHTVAKERALFVASLEREYNRERGLSGQRNAAAAAIEGDLAADASDRDALLFGVAGDLPRDVEQELATLAESYFSVTEAGSATSTSSGARGGASLSVGRRRRPESPLGGSLHLQQSASSAFAKTLSMTSDPAADIAAPPSFEAITERRRRSSVVAVEALSATDLSEEDTQVPLHRKTSVAAGTNRIEGF